LGDVEEAQKAFEMCLKSNHLSSLDRKIVEEASDGLQKTQVLSFWYYARLSTKYTRLNVPQSKYSLISYFHWLYKYPGRLSANEWQNFVNIPLAVVMISGT
jgi:hypothetical protein